MTTANATRRAFLAFAAAALLAATTGCARSVQIGSGPGPGYAIEVVNSLGQDMIVSYDAGSGDRTLGTVTAGATERFTITAPERTAVTVRGRDASGNRTVGPFTVQLAAGATPTVTLR
jgi:hypothetical protein